MADDQIDSPHLLGGTKGRIIDQRHRLRDRGTNGVTVLARDTTAPAIAQLRSPATG